MKYQGSKLRIGKEILSIIKPIPNETWVEPMVGGCGMIRHVSSVKKIAYDANVYVIELWKAIQDGWIPPKSISREQWYHIKENKEEYEPRLVGYAGIAGSYGGCWFAAYSGPNSTGRDYLLESYNSVLKLAPLIKDVEFRQSTYESIEFDSKSVIYLDPPYKGTRSYYNGHKVNHDEFYQWCREKTVEGHRVFISEYEAPEDFVCVWQKDKKCMMSAESYSKNTSEKLFTYSV
jgi:DNA adenine methylase